MSSIEDHDEKKQRASLVPIYRNLPVHFTCPNCDYTGYTIVEQKATYISYILMVIFIFLFGFMISMLLMPLVITLTRSFFHKCPSCFKDVGSDNKVLSILNLKDKVISFNIGEFGVVLSRKIVLGIFLTLLLIVTIYAKLQFKPRHHHGPVVPIYESWETFLKECGREAFDTNDHRQYNDRVTFCDVKFMEKTVINWKGYVIRVEDYRKRFYSFMDHAVVILVRMDPPESEIYPDILLTVDSELTSEIDDVLASLNRGNMINFNATIASFGKGEETTHFHLVNVSREDGFKELPMYIHERGRYADKTKYFRHQLPSGDEPSRDEPLGDEQIQVEKND